MTREEARKQYGTPSGGISARQQAAQKYSYQDNTQDRRKECYEASGYDRLVSDLSRLGEETTAYFQVSHRAKNTSDRFLTRTGEMLSAIKKERDYFARYREYFTEEERRRFNTELDGYESVLRQNRSALESGRGFLPESTAEQVDRGVKLADPLGLRKEQTAQENRAVQTQAVRKGAPSYAASSRYAAENGSGYIPFIRRVQALDEKVKKPNWQRYTAQANQIVGDAGELLSDITAMRQYFRNNAKHFTDTELTEIGDSLDRYERYLSQVSSSVSGYTSRRSMTNPLTGKQVPTGGLVLPTDTDGDGKNDSTVYGGALGLRQNYEHQKPIEDMFTGFESAERLGITEENAAEILSQARTAQEQEERKAEHYREEKERAAAYAKTVPPGDQQADAIAQARVQEYVRKEQSARKLAKDAAERADAAGAVVRSNGGYTLYNIQNTISKAMNSADYAEKSKPQEGVYSYTVDDNANVRLALSDDYDLSDATHIQNPEYGYINGTDEDRGIIINQYAVHNAERDSFASYGYLTDDEKGTFNYLWATEGKDAAMKFLHDLKPTLDYRNGKGMAEASPGTLWGNVLSPMWHGFQGAMRNTEALLQGGREIPVSPGEYETSIRRENAGGLGRHIIDASASFGQMLPSMAISYATGNSTAGAAVTSLTSGAGAYQEGLRGGMTKEQALSYGALVGGAEGFLQSVAGGIPGLKGVLPEAVGEKIAGKITNAFGRWAVKFGANMASEVLEENVQNYLEPLFVTMLTGKDYDAPGWEEFVDTTLSTLLLTGVTNLARISTDLTNEIDEVAQIKAAQAQFATAALSFDESSPIYAMGEKVRDALDSNKFLSGKEFREMLQEAGADQATVDRINKGAFTAEDAEQVAQMAGEAGKRLIVEHFEQSYTKGDGAQWSKERASAAAEVLYRVWRGENVRNADIQKLHLNTEKGASALQNALGVPVTKAGNNNVAANQTFREAEMSYRMARSTAKYGGAEINWKTLPPTQESADAIMVHPEAKSALEAIRRKPFAGTYAEQTRQIMQQLSIWWAANASRFTPEAASIQVERWRAEHPQQTEAPTQAADMDAELPEESTAINDTAEGHTARQQAVIEAYKESVDEGLVEFVQNSVNNKGQNRGRYYLNDVLPRAGQDIYELTGVDASGFKTVLEQRMAEHIYKEHGPEGTTDQSMANLNDIGRIQYVLDNYDTMRQGGRSPSYTTMKPNGKPGTAQTVVYEKAVDGKYYVVEAVPDTKAKTAFVVSAYMQKRAGAPLQTVDEQTSTHTAIPENAVGAPTPISNVPQNGTIVNPSASENSVGAARSGFDRYSHAAIEYGTIDPGENPARVVDVPRSMDGQTRVSTAAAHIMESKLVPDSRLNTVQDLIVSGELSDSVRSMAKLSDDAKALIERDIPASVVSFVQQVERGNVSEALVAQGAHLLSVAGDSDMTAAQYARLYTAMVDLMRNTGRALQAARLVKQLTPEGRMLCLQQAIQGFNDRTVETALRKAAQRPGRDGKETAQIVVPDEMWQAYREATTDKARDAVISDIQKYVADQIPSTLYDKWTALRYLNMLGNFKTQVRNVASNTGAALLYTAKNRVKALVEVPVYGISKVLNRATDGKVSEYERTSPLTPASVADPMLFGQSWKDYTQFKDEILGDTKFKENLRGQYAREIEAKRQIWKLNGQWGTKEDSNAAAKAIRKSAEAGMALLRGYDKVTSFAMEQGDAIFGRFAYAQALSGYLRANGVKSSTFENVDADLMNRARAYAIQQAQEATFRDTNAVSTWFSGFDRNWGRAQVFSRGLLAFRKTPANIGVRIEQFSPLGVLNMFADIIGKTSGFDISGNDIVEAAAKTLTGTGLLYAGFLAAANGLIRGAGGDDDKEKTLDELAGKQDYSIKIGGKWYDISWLAPSSVPFLIGANIFDISERNNDPGFIEALLYITDPMIKTSMLSGLNDAIDTIKWSDSPLTDMVITNVFGYLTQGLSNSLIRQAEQAANKETTYTYIDEESWMPDIMQRVLGKWSQGIPGWDYNQAVMVDELGRTVDKGETAERIFNAFFNPAYYSEEAQNPVVDELQYLYELTQADPTLSEINVVPRWGDKSYSYRDKSGKKVTVRFTAEQYEEYSITRGTAITAMLTDLFKSQTYNEMTDEEKAKAVQSVIQTATQYAKAESKTGYVYQKGENKLLDLAFDAKLPASEVFQAKAYRDDLNEMDASANVKMSHFDNYVSHKGWTDAQKKAVLEAYGSFSTTMRGDTDRYDELTEYIGKDKALTVVDGVGKLEPIGDAKQVSDAQRIRAIAKMQLSDQEKWDAFAVYRDDDWRIEFFRKAEVNPSVYAAYLEAIPQYRVTKEGKPSGQWSETTIKNWLRTTDYSYAVKLKIIDIATMKKPKEEGTK